MSPKIPPQATAGDLIAEDGKFFAIQDDGGLKELVPFNLATYLERQIIWSTNAFGPGLRTEGILKHMAKEADEVREDPTKVDEWIDLIILGLDGAWRTGRTPIEVIEALEAKQTKLVLHTYPDWRLTTQDQPIEHDRSQEDVDGVFRIDYETEGGERGVWHSDFRSSRKIAFAQCREEFDHIARALQSYNKVLETLYVVEVFEKQLGAVACT